MRVTGLEPARLTVMEPKSIASANSAIPADKPYYSGLPERLSRKRHVKADFSACDNPY